jgi:predicted RNA-binding protein YlqC (UPF0109 family)
VKALVEGIIRNLADHPDEVEIKVIEGGNCVIMEIHAHPDDLGKVIGRGGRIINAIRVLMGAMSMRVR